MRGRPDPTWRRLYYGPVGRAHVQYGEGRITARELRRKIEAARLHALRVQKGAEG